MSHRKVDVQQADLKEVLVSNYNLLHEFKTCKIGVGVNNLRNTFTRKGFFAEPALDVVQHFCVRHVVLVQHVF